MIYSLILFIVLLMFSFQEIKKVKNSYARAGIIKTASGEFPTPLYVFAGTDAEVRMLDKKSLKNVKALIANTYHLGIRTKKADDIKKAGGLNKFMNFSGLTITDSGGFQVFSFGFGREHGIGKIGFFPEKNQPIKTDQNLVKITDDGAFFTDEKGRKKFLGPKESVKIQEKIGANIILAFDECTSPFHSYAYTKKSLKRTHAWAKDFLKFKKSKQAAFGIIQGGEFKDLREKSAKFILSLPFKGIAIGGPLGKNKKDMKKILGWLSPILNKRPELPRHLLGIGKPEDIFTGVEKGLDTFDCVIPTREARHGSVYTSLGRIDLHKGEKPEDKNPIEKDCSCPACISKTKKDIKKILKSGSPKEKKEIVKLLTFHNIFWFQNLVEKIRQSILDGNFKEFKEKWLARYNSLKKTKKNA